MVDYSKWDRFGQENPSSSSEDNEEGGIIHQEVEDGAIVRCEPRSHPSRTRKPKVTKLDKPSSLNFGGQPESNAEGVAEKKNVSTRGVETRPPHLGCVTDSYGWEQTALTIDFYLKVPPKSETGRALPKLELKRGIPPVTATECTYPASLGARSFNNEEEGADAFPLAHGITIGTHNIHVYPFVSSVWVCVLVFVCGEEVSLSFRCFLRMEVREETVVCVPLLELGRCQEDTEL